MVRAAGKMRAGQPPGTAALPENENPHFWQLRPEVGHPL